MPDITVEVTQSDITANVTSPNITANVTSADVAANVTTTDVTANVEAANVTVNITGGGSPHIIQDEGVAETQRANLNFVGAGVSVSDDSANNATVVTISGGGGGTWGGIGGNLPDQTDLQTALDGKVDENAAITGATKTKITYDAKGLVTSGADAAIADITGLQTALDGKAASSHTHALSDITQSGATTNQVPKWNGSAWVPANEAGGADGNGIYSGSGTVPGATEATLEPNGSFSINYDGGNQAISVDDAQGSVNLYDKTGVSNFFQGTAETGIDCQALYIGINGDYGNAGQFLGADGLGYVTWQNAAGGGASVTQITYSDMQTAITNGTLTPGGWYLITDASGTDLGFLTNAVTENTINVSGVGGYLNADFQAVGDYSGTPETFNAQLGIWRTAFEAVTINYLNLPPDEIAYTTSSGLLTDGETFTTDLGRSGTVVTDNGSTVTATGVSGALVAGEIITGDISGNTVTVDSYGHFVFAAGDTITGGTTGATAVVVSDDMVSMTVYMTSAGVAFDGSEVLDNGAGVTANQDGAATSPTIVLGDVVIWNLSHYQLTDATLLDGNNPETNTSAYTLLDKATYPETYVTAWDVSEFDFINQWLQYRADLLGNKVFLCKKTEVDVFDNGITAVSVFQFGKPTTFGNVVSDAFVYIANCIGNFYSNSFQSSSYLTGVNILESCNFQYNDFANNAVLQSSTFSNGAVFGQNVIRQFGFISNLSLNDSSFSNNTLFQNSQVSSFSLGQNGQANNNILENGASLTGITAGANCSISRNKVGPVATLGGGTTMGDGAQMNDNVLGPSASISDSALSDGAAIETNNLLGGAQIGNNTLNESALISGNNIGSDASIMGNTLMDSGYISGNILLGADAAISNNTVQADGQIANCTVTPGVDLANKTVQTGIYLSESYFSLSANETEDISDNIEGNRTQSGFSDIPGTIDITGLTTLDCTAAWAQYRGIFNLTSTNATEAIDTITNPPTAFPFTIRPAAGLVLTITGTAYAGIAAGQIALKATDYTLDGDKGEYIVLEIDPLGTGALIEKQVVNGLL